MKQLEKKSKYKRNIYKLLYDQIHTDIADINKEIKIGKNLIVPYTLLKRNLLKNEFLLNKKLNKLDIKELQKEENNNDIKPSKDESKINIPKIKNFNFINNSIITNTTTINSSERKINKTNNKTFSNFSKFRSNNKSNIINLKSRNKTNINIIKAITDQNVDFKDNLYIQDNDEINELNTNNLDLDKNMTKTTLIRVPEITDIKKSKRQKSLYVSYDEKWYLKNKFIYIKLDKLEIESNYIQSQIIGDQYALINESIKHITSKYFVDKDISNRFNTTNILNQKLININIEESIGLMIEISYLLLEKFENCLENFITKILKRQNKKEYKIVEDEKKEFNIILNLFIEASQFLELVINII